MSNGDMTSTSYRTSSTTSRAERAHPARTHAEGRWLGVALAVLASAVWSTTAIFIQPLVTTYAVSPLQLSVWRSLLITPLLAIVLRTWMPDAFAITRREAGYYCLTGLIGMALMTLLWSASVRLNGAAVATVLFFSAPGAVVVGGRIFFRERIHLLQAVAVVLTLAGCVLVSGLHSPSDVMHSVQGLALGLGSGATFAAYTLLGKGASRTWGRGSATVLFYAFLFSAVGLTLPMALTAPATLLPHLPAGGWALLLGLSLGPSLGGYALFTASLHHLPASVAGLFMTLEPPITVTLAWIVFGTLMTGSQWAGAALIMGGVLTVQAVSARNGKPSGVDNDARP